MVRALPWLGLVATGCLSRPPVPIDPDANGGIDVAPSDGPVDAFVYSCTMIPTTFTMRGAPVIANVDRRDGTSSDELIIWGRDDVSGVASVFLMAGGAAFDPNCYHRRFHFAADDENLIPLDVLAGDLTGDGNLDLAMYGRQINIPGPQHEVLLFPGEASGTVRETPTTQTFLVSGTYEPWGGSKTSQEPVYLSATTQTGTTPVAELIIGGLYNWQAALPVTAAPSIGATSAVANSSNMFIAGSQAIQDVEPYLAGNPTQLLFITQSEILRIRSTNVRAGGFSTYEVLSSTTLPSLQQRGVHFAPTLIGGAKIGVTQNQQTGYTIFSVTGTANEQAVISPFDVNATGIDPNTTTSMALESLDVDARLELVTITDDATSDPLLRVYTNLTIAGSAQVGYGFIHQIRVPADYIVLGVGDFDGLPATSRQILVLSNVSGKPTLCYELRSDCIATCGVPSC